ncbi:MAG: DUF3572 family protein [Pseudomonadota bacterium]
MVNLVSQSDAETIALQALAFIASDASLLEKFTSTTGVSIEDLHARAGQRDVLAAALQWLMQNESALLMFCANNAHPPDIMQFVAHLLEDGTG